jgi:uncharacterized iron-regulated membrane protein
MTKALLLRLHRWLALVFAAPLLGLVATGLVLSFEPLAGAAALRPGSLAAESLENLIHRHDPQGRARSLFVRPIEQRILLGGIRPGQPVEVDLPSGEEVMDRGGTLSDYFGLARRIHEHLLLPGGGLVAASTVAMLVLVTLGPLMGWPRWRHTLPGWHRALGWLPLPLLVLSPFTGLLLVLGVGPAPSSPPASGPPPSLVEAVRMLGTGRDPSSLSWIRPIGGSLVARLGEGGEMKTLVVTREGLVPQPRHWPRLLHEGTWGGPWLPLLNVVASLAMTGLLGTGLVLWARRRLRRPAARRPMRPLTRA